MSLGRLHHADMAAAVALDKAKASRLALNGIRNRWHSRRAANLVTCIGRAELVAIRSVSAPPRVVAYGGTSAMLGVTPIASGNRRTVLPFGGYKCFGPALTIQALRLRVRVAVPQKTPLDHGSLFIACDPERGFPGGELKRLLSDYVRRLRAASIQPAPREIRIPSGPAFQERIRRRRHGLHIGCVTYRQSLALRVDQQ